MGDLLQTIIEAFKAEAVAWIVWTALTALTTWCFSSGRQRLKRWWWLRQLGRATKDEVVALVVRVGGESDPLEDVREYLTEKKIRVDHVLLYIAPGHLQRDDPDVAMAVVEDLHDAITQYAEGKLRVVHLFYAGMTEYAFVLGALLGNLVDVVVHHWDRATTKYWPLFRFSRSQLYRPRLTAPLAQLKVVPLKSGAKVATPGADGSPDQLASVEPATAQGRIEPPADDGPATDTVDA